MDMQKDQDSDYYYPVFFLDFADSLCGEAGI